MNFSEIDFFSLEKVELSVSFLKKALTLNHMEAMYVYGIILLYKGGNSNEKEGFYLWDVVKKSTQLEEYRAR